MNPTWDFFDVCVWSNAEINVGLWCICMPALRLVLVQLFPKLLGTAQRYHDKYSNLGNKSADNRKPRSRVGNHSTSHAKEQIRPKQHALGQIRYQKSFTIKYDDRDDLELAIAAKNSDTITAKSTTSISVQESFEE